MKPDEEGRYPRTIQFYRNEHCEGCPLRSQCAQSKHGRTLQRTDKLAEMQIEVRENLLTETGQELLKQRSIQAEGILLITKLIVNTVSKLNCTHN